MMFGKRVPIPRLNAWYGELPYRYSGTTFEASLPPAPLQTLQAQINRDTGWQLNSVLANLYRNGLDHMGWHSDDEQSLGSTPQIASLSLGAQRRFVLRNKKDRSNKHQLNLHHGSLLLMLGRCQRDWQHHLPKSTRLALPRINLTFRESVRH
jgi:alkylated DNA repair dioxygenase AlkB